MTFEEWLTEIIENRGISISDLSKGTGITYHAIYNSLFNVKRGRELRSSELIAICNYLNVNPMAYLNRKKPIRKRVVKWVTTTKD